MADHSIWYPGAPAAEPTLADDNEALVTGTQFYVTGASKYCKGGAWRVPASAVASLPATVTIRLHLVAVGTNPNFAAAPDRSGVANVAAGWIVASWDPIEVAAGTGMWISTDAGEPYLFVGVGTLGVPPIQATDASTLYCAEANLGAGQEIRGYFDYAGGSGENQSQAWFAHDVITTDSLTTVVVPTAIASTAAVAAPTVTTSATVVPTGVDSTTAVAAPTVSTSVTVTPTPIASTSAVGTPSTSGPGWALPSRGELVATTPTRGMTATTPVRAMTALTPVRGLEATT